MLDRQSKIVAAANALAADVDGEIAILNVKNSLFYSLQGAGARIWALCESPIRIEDLNQRLLDEYDVSSEVLERDSAALLDSLLANGLIEVVDDSAPTA